MKPNQEGGTHVPTSSPRPRRFHALCAVAAFVLLLNACGSRERPTLESSASDATSAAAQRIERISQAVGRWDAATSLPAAKAAAEEARNLITGPHALMAGDLDHDGENAGNAVVGLLPGDDGSPGLATPLASCALIERDVLGGPWTDPLGRWTTLTNAITAWTSTNNTFPALPSHPQRIVGWATLTLASNDLEVAHEYAGHARLHVNVTEQALAACQ